MTRRLTHSGIAAPLTLSSALTIPPSGTFDIVVQGNAAGKGWPTIPVESAIVVTVGRGTPQEGKYLVSNIVSTTATSTLTVPNWGRNYDGTTPANLPMGSTVEHTISAVEMHELNDLVSRIPVVSTGELVFSGSSQLLTNKTFNAPVGPQDPATKKYVDDVFTYTPWSPQSTQQGLTFTGIQGDCQYIKTGNRVSGFGAGKWSGGSSSVDPFILPLPVAPQARTAIRTIIGSFTINPTSESVDIISEGNIVISPTGQAMLTAQSGNERFYLRCISIGTWASSYAPDISFTFDYKAAT